MPNIDELMCEEIIKLLNQIKKEIIYMEPQSIITSGRYIDSKVNRIKDIILNILDKINE
jgi:hypothetical protein